MEYYDLMKIIDKEVISAKELRQITDCELVTEVLDGKPDPRRPKCKKYDLKLENGEIYYVYVKKGFFGLFN